MIFTNKIFEEWTRQWKKGPGSAPSSLFIAVSGGPDSMALLETVRHFRHDLTVLHLNHRLRGKEADGDQEFVEAWCRDHRIPCFSESVDVNKLAKEEGLSLEAAGRRARYRFFEDRMVHADHPPILLTAHHQDDQAETVLLHILRGSGLEGGGGIRPLSDRKFPQPGPWPGYRIFRPFLDLSKEDLLGFLEERGVPFREDASNREDDFLRNRIRLQLLPEIESTINPQAVGALSRFARILQVENDYLDRMSQKALADMVYIRTEEDLTDLDRLLARGEMDEWVFQRNAHLLGGVSLRKKDLLDLDPALAYRVIRDLTRSLLSFEDGDRQVTYKDIEQIFHLAGGSVSTWTRLCGMIILCDFQGLSFFPDPGFGEKSATNKGEMGQRKALRLPENSRTLTLSWAYPAGQILVRTCRGPVSADRLTNPRFAYFPAQALTRLSLGPGRPGELFEKFGGGRKPLRKVFNEWKIPSYLRENYPLVWEGERIIWIPWAGRSGYGPLEGETPAVEMEWRPKWTKI